MSEFGDIRRPNPLKFLAESYNQSRVEYETGGYIRSSDGELSYITGETLSATEAVTGDWHDENDSRESNGFNKLGSFYLNTDRGARRQNQDVYYLNLGTEENPRITMGIFDGVGGSENGRLAASLAAVGLAVSMREGKDIGSAGEKMRQNIKEYNPKGDSAAIIVDIKQKKADGQKELSVTIFSSGDSRAIVIRDGKILPEGTTLPQNFAQADLTAGKIGLEEYYNHEQLNRLTSSINSKEFTPQIKEFVAKLNDVILLASDGLGDVVSDFEILEILRKNPSMEIISWELFNLARNRQTSEENFEIEISRGNKILKQITNKEGRRTVGDNITIGEIKIKNYLE